MAVDRSPKGLTRDVVVRAGLDIVAQEGLPALTMRAVARRVGVSPMALYNHTADRDDLLLGMLEAVTAELPVDPGDGDPRASLTRLYLGTHDHLAHHRWALQVLTRGDLVPENSFALADACVGRFLAAGLTPADAIYAHGVCWHLMLGELLDRHPDAVPGAPTQRDRALLGIDLARYPNYAHVLEVLDPADQPPRCQFNRSIGVLLDGLLPGPSQI